LSFSRTQTGKDSLVFQFANGRSWDCSSSIITEANSYQNAHTHTHPIGSIQKIKEKNNIYKLFQKNLFSNIIQPCKNRLGMPRTVFRELAASSEFM
jgi:hypothetical protein